MGLVGARSRDELRTGILGTDEMIAVRSGRSVTGPARGSTDPTSRSRTVDEHVDEQGTVDL